MPKQAKMCSYKKGPNFHNIHKELFTVILRMYFPKMSEKRSCLCVIAFGFSLCVHNQKHINIIQLEQWQIVC